jgi:hypothetical protein
MTTSKYTIPLLLVVASLASLAFASLAGAQVSGSAGSSIAITRTPYLSIDATPDSFAFPSAPARATVRDIFSSTDGALSADKVIRVTDARASGGFILQAQASDFTNGINVIPASALRIVSTADIGVPPEGVVVNNVHYLNPFTGVQKVTAPVNAATSEFSQAGTYDEVQNRPQNNVLNVPVDILSGCLPATEGRVGSMAIGLAFTLKIPPYTVPDTYNSTITYTITDFTSDSCP